MKGKIAFVVGAAVGYVLGSRAGRQRYEQIKRGATNVWNTAPVQKGVGVVRGVIDDKADDLKAYLRRASSDAFANLARQTGGSNEPSASGESTSRSARKPAAASDASDGGPAKADS